MADIEVRASGTVVSASPSDRIVVRLPENGGTGYQWSVVELGELLEMELSEFVQSGQIAPGAAGERLFIIRPLGLGRARVALQLKREWENEPIDHFNFDVDIADR